MKYKDDFETLDSKIFEQMAKEYYSKTKSLQNVEVLAFDINSTFKSQLENVLNIVYAINLKNTKNPNPKLSKMLHCKMELEKLDKELFLMYSKLYKKTYLMPICSKINAKNDKNNILFDYFLLIKALIECDFYMLKEEDKRYFRAIIIKYFKLIFSVFSQ